MKLARTLTLLAGLALGAPAAAQSPASHPQGKPPVAPEPVAVPEAEKLDTELEELESMAPKKPAPAPPAAPPNQAKAPVKAPKQPPVKAAAASMAGDDGEPEEETAAPETKARWYGGYTLGVDAASLVLLFAAGSTGGEAPLALSIGGYLFGGPIVHAAHGNGGRALGSLGLRVGLPLLGVALASNTSSGCEGEPFCGLGQAALGFGMGVVGAMLIDGIAIARDTVPVDPPAADLGLSIGRDRAVLVASGRF